MLSSLLRARVRALVLFSAGPLVPLGAQVAAPPAPTQLAPVVVPGREADLAGLATSASQGTVGAGELAARPFLRRGELLEVIPGVVVTQHSGNGKANQYFLRGFNLDHGTDFSLGVDGMPVNLRSHAHGQGYADLNFLIPEVVRQVDYSKGPFFAEVGDFSAAGAAEFRQVDRLDRPFAKLSVGAHRFARLVAGASQATRAGTVTGAFEAAHDDGPWQLAENGRRLNGYARLVWQSGSAEYRLTGMAYGGAWRATDQIPLRAVETGALDRFGHVDASDGGASARLSASFDATWRAPASTTRLTTYALFYRLNLFSNFTYFLEDPLHGDQFNQRDRRWVLGGALERTWDHSAGAARGATTVGLQTRADLIDELGLHRTARRAWLSTIRDDRVDEGSVSLFARHERGWTDWLRSTAGLRLDGYGFRVRSDDPRNSGSRLADIASPKLSLAFGPWRNAELYLNGGLGFHSNDARGTTVRIDPQDGSSPLARVTPLARSRGAEAGLRLAPAPGLVTTVSLWALELDSELVFVGDAGATEPAGRSRRRGVELANFYRLAPWCRVDADVAFTHARYREDTAAGAHIPNSIATVVTGGLALGRERSWFGGGRLRYHGPQPLVESDTLRAPSSLTCHATAGWRARTWQVSVELLNVFDRKNYDIAYAYPSRLPGEPAAGLDDLHFHPAEPFTVRLEFVRWF